MKTNENEKLTTENEHSKYLLQFLFQEKLKWKQNIKNKLTLKTNRNWKQNYEITNLKFHLFEEFGFEVMKGRNKSNTQMTRKITLKILRKNWKQIENEN